LLPGLRAEIGRECERHALLRQQIRRLELQQDKLVRNGAHPAMALLARLAGLAPAARGPWSGNWPAAGSFSTAGNWPAPSA
jgi:hypothetical protein